MKRGAKVALLAALGVGLCFVLAGCYIAPDDINNSGNMTTNSGNLPFQTLAPTATVAVTPDTVVVVTQNLFGGPQQIAVTNSGIAQTPQPAATPTPTTGGGWNDWGTVSGQTANPAVSAVPLVTAQPQSSVITFTTATPAPATAATTAGSVVVNTPTPRPTIKVVTAAPATPTRTPPSLQVGFKGSSEVRRLQKRLKELGYYNGSVDGDFGKGTEAAVKAFQKDNGLSADGKAGAKTLEKLYSRNALTKKQANATATPRATAKATARPTATPKRATATPRPTATPNLTKDYYLQAGSSGAKVRTLQNRLIELGWLSGRATGEYDEATEAAVRAFQKKTKGLWDDGVAGPDTLRALYSSGAARATGAAASTGETLERGSEGDAVRTLQRRLKALGYLSGSVDGSYGVATEAAVIAFQQANGLTADGKAGTATLNRIYSDTAVKSTGTRANTSTVINTGSGRETGDIASTGYVTLQMGSEGEQVRRLQQQLKDLGYYSGSVDGKFGEGTATAVMAFQLRNSLTVDGKAGPATQRALFGSGTAISYSAMRQGENGAAVRNLQYTLYELGYYDGSIDGDYGQTTADAVRAFQIQNKLTPVDGVAGNATLAKLYSSSAIPASAANPDYVTTRPGDKGELVVEIQDCLKQMGYLDNINGEYDETTTEAIRQFQKDNGLTADGVAGEKTLQILFGY